MSKNDGKVGKKPLKRKMSLADGRSFNQREKKTIEGVVSGKSIYRSMIDAGYTEQTAHTQCTKKRKELMPTIQALMEKRGLTDDRLLDVLERGLDATKVISCNIIAIDKEGMKDADSMTKDFVDVPDYATQHKFLDTGLKLKGHLRDKMDVTITSDISDRLQNARLKSGIREIDVTPDNSVSG